MRVHLPGPNAVIGAAAAAADAVEAAIGLVPRAVDAMSRVESLLDRAETLVARTEGVVAAADEAATRTHKTLDTVEIVTRTADRHTAAAAGMIERADASMRTWEPTLRRLAPSADRFATALGSHEVDAAIALVDRLPLVLDHMENDVLPMLKTLDRVGPDLHEVLEVVEDLRRVITGLPGVGLLRRRGDDEPPPVASSVHKDGNPSARRR
jgi:hypothetical protein